MRKNISGLFVTLVMSVSLGLGFTASLAQTGVDQYAQSKDEQEAARLYTTLPSLSMRDRKALFNGLTPELKSELWKAHLRLYLSKHLDFTEKQRAAVQGAIALITPRLFDIPQDSPDWQTNVHEPIQRLMRKILEVFPREVARELLTFLGGPEPQQESNLMLTKKDLPAFKPISRSVAQRDCTCSTRSDWCSGETECLAGNCQATRGCGTFWLYSCNGECGLIIEVF